MKKITAITIIALFLFFDNIQAQQRYGKCYQKTALPEGVTHQDLFTPLLQKIPAGAYASAGVYLVEVPCDSYVGNNYFTVDTAHIETEKKYWVPKQNHDQFMITGNGSHRSGNPCAAISDLITDMINTMDTTFSSPEQMGALAADSISAVNSRMRDLHIQDRLVLSAPEGLFLPDTTSYFTWLSTVFAGATTTADSIEKLCKWVPAHYAYDEYDPRSDTLSADSMYYMILRYELRGQCGDYATFVAKVASKNFPTWGYPVVLSGRSDTSIPGAGQQPSHIFVGFAKRNGKIWLVADPTIGGVLRDGTTGNPITYDVFRTWIHHKKKSLRVSVDPAVTTVQMWGQCVLSSMLKDTVGLEYFSTGILAADSFPADITRGHWFTYGESGGSQYSYYTEYWKAAGYPRNCIYNIYDHLEYGGGLLFGRQVIARRIMNRYGFPVWIH